VEFSEIGRERATTIIKETSDREEQSGGRKIEEGARDHRESVEQLPEEFTGRTSRASPATDDSRSSPSSLRRCAPNDGER